MVLMDVTPIVIPAEPASWSNVTLTTSWARSNVTSGSGNVTLSPDNGAVVGNAPRDVKGRKTPGPRSGIKGHCGAPPR